MWAPPRRLAWTQNKAASDNCRTSPCLVIVVIPCVLAGASMANFPEGPATGLLMTAAVLGNGRDNPMPGFSL